MPEENERTPPQNLRGDEALLALIIAGRWGKPSIIPYYTRTISIPSEGIARLYDYWKNEDASDGTEA